MLDYLIEDFDTEFLKPLKADQQAITGCLRTELQNLADTSHLEKNVVSEPLFEWDYRAIDDGFLHLMEPFMRSESHIPLLFCSILRDLGCAPEKYLKASLLLEYSYYAIGVIDYFNFHDVFTKSEQNLLKYSELTQVRYAAQYLIQYPRYLVIQNAFNLDHTANIELHKLYANVGVTTGIGRGVFIKWANKHFKEVSKEYYFQNNINVLNNFFIFPAVLAGIIAGVDPVNMERLKKAFSALTLVAKLRLERKLYQDQTLPAVDEMFRDLNLLVTFPGVALIQGELKIDSSLFQDMKYPSITKMYTQLCDSMTNSSMEKSIATIEDMEHQCFQIFLEEIEKTGLLADTLVRIRNSFSM